MSCFKLQKSYKIIRPNCSSFANPSSGIFGQNYKSTLYQEQTLLHTGKFSVGLHGNPSEILKCYFKGIFSQQCIYLYKVILKAWNYYRFKNQAKTNQPTKIPENQTKEKTHKQKIQPNKRNKTKPTKKKNPTTIKINQKAFRKSCLTIIFPQSVFQLASNKVAVPLFKWHVVSQSRNSCVMPTIPTSNVKHFRILSFLLPNWYTNLIIRYHVICLTCPVNAMIF